MSEPEPELCATCGERPALPPSDSCGACIAAMHERYAVEDAARYDDAEPEFKPCPFCGGEEVYLEGTDDSPLPGWWADCVGCGARTGRQASEVEAIVAWNRRAPV